MEAAACAKSATGYTYARREPEKTALFQVLQQHLLTFEQEWTDKSDGRTLPGFVTDELHDFLGCGILARGLAQLFCPTCHARYVVAWSCKGRGFCPSCGGRRMNAGALTLVDYVLPEVPIRRRGRDGPSLWARAAPRTEPSERHYRTRLPPRVLTSKRSVDHGCWTRATGIQRRARTFIRRQFIRSFWLRRRSARCQCRTTSRRNAWVA